MPKEHYYNLKIEWTGNKGKGTIDYRSYDRSHTVSMEGKPHILCSSDAAFRGDKTKYTPEDLLVASLSGCHMLWYLHLCSDAGVVVVDYTDSATGTMLETADGGGYFTEATLYPTVTIADASMKDLANELHKKAHELCFIAKSVNFPVYHKPVCNIL